MRRWRVEIFIDGDKKLSIEPGCLSGDPNISEYNKEIREAAMHLLGFAGSNDDYDCFACDGDDPKCPVCGISEEQG